MRAAGALLAALPACMGHDVYVLAPKQCAAGWAGEDCTDPVPGTESRSAAAEQSRLPASSYHTCRACVDAGYGWCPGGGGHCGNYWNSWCEGDPRPAVPEEVLADFSQKKDQGCYWGAYRRQQDYLISPGGGATVAECAARCRAMGPQCTGFEYPLDGKYCAPWLHGACTGEGARGWHDGGGYDLFVRKDAAPALAAPAPAGFAVVRGAACGWCVPGREYREGQDYDVALKPQGVRWTAEQCAAECRSRPGCTGFELPVMGTYCAPWYNGQCSSKQVAAGTWIENESTKGLYELYVADWAAAALVSAATSAVPAPRGSPVNVPQCHWGEAQCSCGPCRRRQVWGEGDARGAADARSGSARTSAGQACAAACQADPRCGHAMLRVHPTTGKSSCYLKQFCHDPRGAVADGDKAPHDAPQWMLYRRCSGGVPQDIPQPRTPAPPTPAPVPRTPAPAPQTKAPVRPPVPAVDVAAKGGAAQGGAHSGSMHHHMSAALRDEGDSQRVPALPALALCVAAATLAAAAGAALYWTCRKDPVQGKPVPEELAVDDQFSPTKSVPLVGGGQTAPTGPDEVLEALPLAE
eukprot:TRINITY_DN47191_c0_g1_i1.p1 TRINITY_DN47191_c0_g1~~TRINITY_DN47191_c0_g1_i1.p1  ORF type:complete len:580 (+),score=126.49 TRINITY_DN47191_c0_g1_i1:104-1843(+)